MDVPDWLELLGIVAGPIIREAVSQWIKNKKALGRKRKRRPSARRSSIDYRRKSGRKRR